MPALLFRNRNAVIAELIADLAQPRNERLDVAAGAAHGFLGDGAGVRIDRLVAHGWAEGDELGPDPLVFSGEVAIQVGGHGWRSSPAAHGTVSYQREVITFWSV